VAQDANGKDGPDSVPSELYTREYFTTDCDGYQEFMQGSVELPERLQEALNRAGDLRGKRVLDVGCGRGELAREIASRGAQVVGIDYAEAALELARELTEPMAPELRKRVAFLRSDAKVLPFDDAFFDTVFMVDVYEHLYPHEITATLEEIKRVLRPEGLLVIHTGPNTWFYDFGYPMARFVDRKLLGREPVECYRHESDEVLHVNEQSPLSLHRGLKNAGFRPKVRLRSFSTALEQPTLRGFAKRFLSIRPFGYLFCQSLLATAYPSTGRSESRLRMERVSNMVGPSAGKKVLLIGDREGSLATRLGAGDGAEVIWLQPGGGGKETNALQEANGYTRPTGDCGKLTYEDRYFDRVVSQLAIEHLQDPEAALREWARVLKDNGKLVLVTRNRLFNGADQNPQPRVRQTYTPAELREMLERAGLTVKETSTLIPDLKLPALYRGDLSFSLFFEKLPYFSVRGKLLFVSAEKHGGGPFS
jgi:ubiquinone/menaquinone biosynthesis C-methylase UbiE